MGTIKEEWEAAKWIFEPEGAFRDIYIEDVGLAEWLNVVDFLNQSYPLRFLIGDESKQIDTDYVRRYLEDEDYRMDAPLLFLEAGNVGIDCHFFDADRIEFNINTEEIETVEDYQDLKRFMWDISTLTGKLLILTMEHELECPLIKVNALEDYFCAFTDLIAKQLYGK